MTCIFKAIFCMIHKSFKTTAHALLGLDLFFTYLSKQKINFFYKVVLLFKTKYYQSIH